MNESPDLPLRENGKAAQALPQDKRVNLIGRIKQLRLWRIPLVMALLFTGASIGLYFQPPALRAFFDVAGLQPGAGSSAPIAVPPSAAQEQPQVHKAVIVALGRLQPEGNTVVLGPPFGAGDARVARLFVAEGDVVHQGQLIAELDSLPQLQSALLTAQANLAAKEAALQQARASISSALTEAIANHDRAASAADLAAEEAARQRDLFAKGATTKSALDRAEAAAVQASRELDRAAAQMSRQSGGEAQPDVAVAARLRDVAQADVDRATVDLAKGKVFAPISGQILTLHLRAGEKPGASGIATMGATDRMEAEIEVYQTDIAQVKLGQSVQLFSPALAQPLAGKVTHIGLQVGRQTILAADPAANTDARIVRTRVALDAASSDRAASLTGLEVSAHIETGPVQ